MNKRKILMLIALCLTFTALFAVMIFSSSAADGDIYLEEYDVTIPAGTNANFVVLVEAEKQDGTKGWELYKKDGNVVTYGSSFGDGAVANTKNLLVNGSGAYSGGTVVLYMLKDTTMTGNASNRLMQINGTLKIDLGGHTLTASKPRLVGFECGSSDIAGGNPNYTSAVEFYNGKISITNPVVEVFSGNSTYQGEKKVDVIFDNVEFSSYNNSTSVANIVNVRGTYISGQSVNVNVTTKDCTFNYSNNDGLNILNDATTSNSTPIKSNLSVTAGTVKLKNFNTFKASSEAYVFNANAQNQRTQFVFGYTATAPTITFNTDAGEMHLAPTLTTNKSTTTYGLTNVKTKYGYVPMDKKNTAFLIFYNDLYLDSRGNYCNLLDRLKSLLYNTSGTFSSEELTVLVNGDYDYANSLGIYQNFAQINGKIVFDLNNHTITLNDNSMFELVGKAVDGNLTTTEVTLKDGTIRTKGAASVSRISSTSNFDYDGTKSYGFTYENVRFEKTDASQNYVQIISSYNFNDNKLTPTKKINLNAVFTDCAFITPNSSVLFDLSASALISADITVNGGSLSTNEMNPNGIMIKHTEANDELTLGKNESGKFMTLTMPKTAATPKVNFNSGELEFVKISESGDYANYNLTSAGLNSYVPKMSITLAANLSMNVYVPVANTLHFTLNGTEYSDLSALSDKIVTLSDGKTYYRMTAELAAAEAAESISLAVTISYADSSVNGSFTFSIPKYAKKVIAAENAIEVQIVKDVISYIKAAYVYFDKDDDMIKALDSLLGDGYDAAAPESPEASFNEPDCFESATFNLTSTPAIRFYLKSGADENEYSFVINGDAVPFVTDSDKDGKYVEINVYAYAMCEAIECYCNGEAVGSYHIASYLAWAKKQNNPDLVTLVERFWKYAESARDYKMKITTVINYVDESGNTLAPSSAVKSALGESLKLLSPAVEGYYTRDIYVSTTADQNKSIDVVYSKIPEGADAEKINELLANIASWGDSITHGSNADNLASATQYNIDLEALGSSSSGGTYSSVLENLIAKYVYDGIDVANCGVGGESTATIAARANTENYYLELGATTTFGSEPVVIPINQVGQQPNTPTNRVGFLRNPDTRGSICNVTITDADGNSISGIVSCKVSLDIPSTETNKELWNCNYIYLVYTFTRTDGKTDPITINEGARIITRGSVEYDGRSCIIFMGENGGFNNDFNELIKEQEEILNACGSPEYFLIISSTSGSNESRKAITEALSARWGENYINMGNELNSLKAYKFVGYTEDDIAPYRESIENGEVTILLLADGCHPNAVGYAYIGNVIFERFFDLGMFDALFDYYDSLNEAN